MIQQPEPNIENWAKNMKRSIRKTDYEVLFNQDYLWRSLGTAPGGSALTDMETVQCHVDLVADAGCDALALCPNSLYQVPGWDSDHDPFWREEFHTRKFEGFGCNNYKRAGELILDGFDVIQIAQNRAQERGIAFLFSWRMNESQFVEIPGSDTTSRFWREHPEYRIGGPSAPLAPEGKGTNRTCRKRLALCFLHQEVRDYQFGFVEELCRRYKIDGLELDFLRWPWFFPDEMPFEEKAPVMTAFVQRIKEMVDQTGGKRVPIIARVPNRLDLLRDIGLDLMNWVERGLINSINISALFHTQPDGEIEAFRKAYPEITLHAEIGHCISSDPNGRRIMTREMFHATAHSFLERGADGISLFNLPYANPRGQRWPDYSPLQHIADCEFLARQPKHYFIGDNQIDSDLSFSKQLDATLTGDRPVILQIHLADANPAHTFSRAILRLMAKQAIKTRRIAAFLHSVCLDETAHEGELFETPYEGGIPETQAVYKDFLVPLNLLQKGWNAFEFGFEDRGEAVTLTRMELALYP